MNTEMHNNDSLSSLKTVYTLYHTYGPEEDRAETLKLIGIYSTRENAEKALERVKDKPGFRSRQEGFEIFSHRLDRDGWVDGFAMAWSDGSFTDPDE